MELNQITERIIGAAYEVSNTLGCGFLEKVYENALVKELKLSNIFVELKAVKQLTEIHEAQLINYLKATNKKVGLLINFGTPKIQIKRFVNRL